MNGDEIDEMIDEEIERQEMELLERRNNYRQHKCHAIGASIEKGFFYLLMYDDLKEKSFWVGLDEKGARAVRKWAERYLNEQTGIQEGYL